MKILHLFANWKWTGPADPALSLAAAQVSAGDDVRFASGVGPGGQASRVLPHVRERDVEPVEGLQLGKHARFRANREDARRLADMLREWEPDIVHTHLDNDHRIASVSVRETGIGRVVRTSYDASGLSGGVRVRRVARRAMHGLIVTSKGGWENTLAAYDGSAHSISVGGRARPIELIEPGILLSRFDPSRFDRAAERRNMELADDDVAVAIVARVQTHRRFEIVLDAVERLAPELPQLRVIVIGRGTNIERLLHQPVRERALGSSIRASGYLEGDAYPAALAALDAALFLVPGSDETCRALREQMAMGLAPIVSPRPPLPEIVDEGNAGMVVEETTGGLVRGLRKLVTEAGLRQRLGKGAAAAARERFDSDVQAGKVRAFYERVLES